MGASISFSTSVINCDYHAAKFALQLQNLDLLGVLATTDHGGVLLKQPNSLEKLHNIIIVFHSPSQIMQDIDQFDMHFRFCKLGYFDTSSCSALCVPVT